MHINLSLCSSYCRYHKKVSNIIDDVLEWSPKLALSGMMDKKPVNATERESPPTEGSTVFSPPEEPDSDVSVDAGTDAVGDSEGGFDDMPDHEGSRSKEEI